jgi:DNA-binding MarR family transcriptional regulator
MTINIYEEKVKSISELGRLFSDATILMHESIASNVGLSGTDHKYLGLILRNGSMTAGKLSTLTGLTTGAITGVIDRLEKKKLVKREFEAADRRKIMIVPDHDMIKQVLGGTSAELQRRIIALFNKFSENEIGIIEKYLLTTIETMNNLTNDLRWQDIKIKKNG